MRIVFAALFVTFLPALALAHETAAPLPPVPETNAATEEAANAVDAFHKALMKGDRQAAQALLDDQVQIYEQGWVERSKVEYASHHLESDAEFSAATSATQTARSAMIVGDLAYVASEGTVTGTFKGKAINSITLETMVLRRTQDGWHIVHIHWSSRAPKK
ncbi:MAG: SnoaL-like domain-containing protein [Alphaproteobacteria bacterium]|nr:SnoaL-like domain-containing protein [Alphaproteobacteria bacterium]